MDVPFRSNTVARGCPQSLISCLCGNCERVAQGVPVYLSLISIAPQIEKFQLVCYPKHKTVEIMINNLNVVLLFSATNEETPYEQL